uniref:Uncharacterized protein n=1 Tax=Romanomermis culicivorax TaxID=13658 RepID=A0A915KPP5_ROMCU
MATTKTIRELISFLSWLVPDEPTGFVQRTFLVDIKLDQPFFVSNLCAICILLKYLQAKAEIFQA